MLPFAYRYFGRHYFRIAIPVLKIIYWCLVNQKVYPCLRQLTYTYKFKCPEPTALKWVAVIIGVDGINSILTK
jgi:hypothetical protein